MWVIFEGLDKAGKTTLEWEFLKATNFKHVIIDRGPVGYLVFDTLFERITEEGRKLFLTNLLEMKYSNNFLVVYCKAPIDVVLQRLEEHNEFCPYNYKFAQKLYDEGVKELYEDEGINVVTIDTTKSIKECVDLIIEKLEEVMKGEL